MLPLQPRTLTNASPMVRTSPLGPVWIRGQPRKKRRRRRLPRLQCLTHRSVVADVPRLPHP